MRSRLGLVVVGVGVVVAGWAMLAIPAPATRETRTTADEPQYLLSAQSLAEDHDLWIDDELSERAYWPFHEARLPIQTEQLDNGRSISPHDPLLPAILAVPMGLGGWAWAKATLALLAGVLAAVLTWTAVTVLAFGLAAPLSSYGTQVYPELPAALAVAVAIAGLTAPFPAKLRQNRPETGLFCRNFGWVAAVVVLPWLGGKYLPVAAVLAVLGLARTRSPTALAALAGAGVVYLVGHRLLYGGWTVYAAGDHFAGGELTAVGSRPHYLGRSRRIVGLLLDREFGLAVWMPGYLLAVPAFAALLRRRPPGWAVLALPLAAGWATATWVALTMHGWWWPGRQTVVVLPCVVLAVAWWAGRVAAVRPAVVVTGVLGAVSWLWLVVEARRGDLTLVFDFATTRNPAFRALHAVLPDYRHPDGDDWLLQAAWLLALGAVAAVAAIEPRFTRSTKPTRSATHVPA